MESDGSVPRVGVVVRSQGVSASLLGSVNVVQGRVESGLFVSFSTLPGEMLAMRSLEVLSDGSRSSSPKATGLPLNKVD